MSANVNTCAQLAKVQLIMDSVWADSAKNKDYIANVEVARAVRENQTVRIVEAENPMKDKTVTLYWPEFCGVETTDCTTDCDAGGTKPGTQCKDYELDMCREVKFSVDHKTYRALAVTMEEAMAVSFLANMQALDEWVAQQFVYKLHANKGVNLYTGGKGVVSGFETAIKPAYWNANLMSYFKLVAAKNKFSSPYMISGTNMFEAYENAIANAAHSDGKGAKTMFDSFKFYFDIFNIDTILSPDMPTFMVNKNALAFHNKAYWDWSATDARAEQFGGVGSSAGLKYKIESKNLPGVFYDVTYKVSCANDEISHNWKMKFTGDIFTNPVGCNPNNTNILEFVCE
jgi:hypothetical protein